MTKLKYYNSELLELDHDEFGEILIHKDTDEPVTGIVWKNFSDGNKLYESSYLKGKIHGYDKEWYRNGKLKFFSTRYKDILHGVWVFKTDTGFLDTKKIFSYGYCLSTEYYKEGVLQKVEKIEKDSDKLASYQKRKSELEASGESKEWNKVLKWIEDI